MVGVEFGEGDRADDGNLVEVGHRQRGEQATTFVVGRGEQAALAQLQEVEGEEPDGEVVEGFVAAQGALVLDVATAAFLHQLEVDPAVLVVDDDFAVEQRGLAVEVEDAGDAAELGGEVDVVAAGEHRGAVGGDAHGGAVAVQLVLVGPLGAAAQAPAVGLGQHRLDPGGDAGGVTRCHAGLRSRSVLRP